MRRPAVAACLLLAATATVTPVAVAAPAPAPPPRQEVTEVRGTHPARARPDAAGRQVGLVRDRRPITGTRTVLPILAHAVDARGGGWLKVRLPGRVIGRAAPVRAGWISARGTRVRTTAWHLAVDLSDRRLRVWHAGRLRRSVRVVVGAPSTPTPRGTWFVEENVRMPADRAGGPFALALSARSGVLQEFAGGPGQIALHGRMGVGGLLGTAVSHGCVRLDDAAITWLAARIAPGVPVTVVS